ncbi:MAG: TIGR02206 family membrane protein [Planctomycetota bacterium]|nr:TIGR02206 family membrane protein [Planctomycetota bacterium]
MSDVSETLVAYGPAHMAALAVIAAAAVVAAGVVGARRRAPGSRVVRRVCRTLAAVLLVNMIFEQCYRVATGQWSLAESLPLHLCDLSVFAAITALVLATRATVLAHATQPAATQSRGRAAFDVVYYWGLAGATQALLTPSVGQGFPGPLFFTYFTAHGSIVVAVLVLIFGLRLRPQRGSAVRVWLLTNVVAVPVLACDWLLRANYMYLRGPAEAPSVLDYLGDWPWPFLPSLNLLVAVCIALCYAPWWWIDRRRRIRGYAR